MRFTKSNQEKLHAIFKSLNFTIRYERGNFHGGYCIVKEQRVIIINKFYPLESKINTLVEILKEIDMNSELLSPEQLSFIEKVTKAS